MGEDLKLLRLLSRQNSFEARKLTLCVLKHNNKLANVRTPDYNFRSVILKQSEKMVG